MKIDNINKQPNFKGLNLPKLGDRAGKFIANHPLAIGSLASASVIAQKIVMSGSEAVLGSAMDLAVGKTITKVTGEKDGRTNESSKKQAVRTFSQSTGGTITGVIIRGICIFGATLACSKACSKAGSAVGKQIMKTIPNKRTDNAYLVEKNAEAWGRSIGGIAAIGVMMFTNFLLDVPLVNWINKKTTDFIVKQKSAKQLQQNGEAK